MTKVLAQSIFKTLAFFDAQDLPLTLMEIKVNLVSNDDNAPSPPLNLRRGRGELFSLFEIQNVIAKDLADKIQHQDGFYFLSGREDLVRFRQHRYRISLACFRKTQKFLHPLRFFPYVRAVAISGSTAFFNAAENSDIDLLIITAENRIWFARLVLSLYFQILGQRRYGKKIASRFCLNHYLVEGHEISEDRNLYTAAEYANLLPVLGEKVLERFWMQNQWIKEYLVSPVLSSTSPFFPLRFRRGDGGEVRTLAEFFFEITGIGPLLNFLSGLYQKRRIRMQEYILVSDSELSFHPGSRGQRVLAKFRQNCT